MQISHFPQIVFQFDAKGREVDQRRVNSPEELAAAVAAGWTARELPSLRAIEAAARPVLVYPRMMYRGKDDAEARANSDEEREALERDGFSVRALPCELPDDVSAAPGDVDVPKKSGRPKKSED